MAAEIHQMMTKLWIRASYIQTILVKHTESILKCVLLCLCMYLFIIRANEVENKASVHERQQVIEEKGQAAV